MRPHLAKLIILFAVLCLCVVSRANDPTEMDETGLNLYALLELNPNEPTDNIKRHARSIYTHLLERAETENPVQKDVTKVEVQFVYWLAKFLRYDETRGFYDTLSPILENIPLTRWADHRDELFWEAVRFVWSRAVPSDNWKGSMPEDQLTSDMARLQTGETAQLILHRFFGDGKNPSLSEGMLQLIALIHFMRNLELNPGELGSRRLFADDYLARFPEFFTQDDLGVKFRNWVPARYQLAKHIKTARSRSGESPSLLNRAGTALRESRPFQVIAGTCAIAIASVVATVLIRYPRAEVRLPPPSAATVPAARDPKAEADSAADEWGAAIRPKLQVPEAPKPK